MEKDRDDYSIYDIQCGVVDPEGQYWNYGLMNMETGMTEAYAENYPAILSRKLELDLIMDEFPLELSDEDLDAMTPDSYNETLKDVLADYYNMLERE